MQLACVHRERKIWKKKDGQILKLNVGSGNLIRNQRIECVVFDMRTFYFRVGNKYRQRCQLLICSMRETKHRIDELVEEKKEEILLIAVAFYLESSSSNYSLS